jgi:hypothetical protein
MTPSEQKRAEQGAPDQSVGRTSSSSAVAVQTPMKEKEQQDREASIKRITETLAPALANMLLAVGSQSITETKTEATVAAETFDAIRSALGMKKK